MLPTQMAVENGGDGQANKRRRLDYEVSAYAALETQCAQPDVSLEVDILILDYLAYQAACAAVASRGADVRTSASLPSNLSLLDSFLAIFKARHSGYKVDEELSFRLLLLKLVVLYTQRLTRNPTTPDRPALDALRNNNRTRAESWLDKRPELHELNCSDWKRAEQADLEGHRAFILHSLGIPAEDDAYEDAHYGTPDCVSLLDILPLFMQASAARDVMNGAAPSMTHAFMTLAAEFMLQAFLEQVLIYGTHALQALREAFAWGFRDGHAPDEWAPINDMFCDPVYEEELHEWQGVRDAHRSLIVRDQQKFDIIGNVEQLSAVASDYPIADFNSKVLGFLTAMVQSIPTPVLVQLETGQLDGMSKEETRDFIETCGLSVAQFWKEPAGFKGVVS